MDAEKPYALPLDDLLLVLRASVHTSQVRAEVPASLLPASLRRGTYHVEVLVAEGQMVACAIRDQAGVVQMEGAQAFEAVRACEQLIWRVTSTAPAPQKGGPSPVQATPALSAPPVPWASRPAPIKLQPTADLEDRRVRKIWLLIDGRRTVADLATLLQLPLAEVDEALTRLATRGLIASGRPERR